MRLRKRGIVLIGILVLTLLATFFIGALLQMNPSRLRRSVQDEKHDHAAAAARAGMEYALGRLAEDQSWRGTGNGLTVETDTMVVREDKGNVLGWIRTPEGEWAGFRLRFNYQDGPGGPDNLDDPSPSHMIATESISLNNLADSERGIPLGTGPNNAYEGQNGFTVPENSVALKVEGLVGPGVAPDNGPTAPVQTGTEGLTTVRTLEAIFSVSGYSKGMPDGAVLQAGGNSTFILGNASGANNDFNGYLRLRALDQTAMMRTKGASSIESGEGKISGYNFYPDMHAEVRVGQPGFSPNTKSGQEFTVGVESPNDALMQIAWDKVAVSDQQDRLRLPAGVYTVAGGNTDSSDKSRISYFPMTFAEYRAALIAGETPVSAPVPEDFLARVELNGKTWNPAGAGGPEKRDLIKFDKDIEVQAVDGNSDFVIVPASGAKQKAESDMTSAISASSFATLEPSIKLDTGNAIADYIASKTNNVPLSLVIDGSTFTIDSAGNYSDATARALATAVIEGTPIQGLPTSVTFPGSELTYRTLTTSSEEDGGSGITGSWAYTGSYSWGGDTQIHVDGGGGGYGGYYGSEVIDSPAPAPSSTPVLSGLRITDANAFLTAVQSEGGVIPSDVLETNVDPLDVPAQASDDPTVPQDLEIVFDPPEGESAAIRTDGDVLLGSHLSGKGGAIVAGGRIDLVGLGIDLNAGQGERDGVSLYAKGDINISTYDQKRNKYWDASIKGVIFSEGNLSVRLGESTRGTDEPSWGSFDFLGSTIVLGSAPAMDAMPLPGGGTNPKGTVGESGEYQNPTSDSGTPIVPTPVSGPADPIYEFGNAFMIAEGIRLVYEPKFLAPYVEEGRVIPIFAAVSIVEK